jgi:uncharacterized protein (TIGR02271 family)
MESKDSELKATDPGMPNEQTYHLELQEERLRIERESRTAGTVRIGKKVIERIETVSVPLREEIIVIECVSGSGTVMVGDRTLREGETFELTVLKEQVNVSKDVVVYEDITIRKEQVTHTERIRETLRREDLVVDHTGDLSVTGDPAEAAPPTPPAIMGEGLDAMTTARMDRDAIDDESTDADTDALPLSPRLEASGTAVVGERPFEYTYGVMEDSGDGPLAEGLPVVTADGEPLGTVGAIDADRFQVRIPLGGDLWLPRDTVSGMAPGGDIALTVTRDEVEASKATR